MHEMLIPALVFAAVVAFGGAVLAAVRSLRSSAVRKRLGGLGGSGGGVPSAAGRSAVVRALGGIGRAVCSEELLERLRTRLAEAGYTGEGAAAVYFGVKLALLGIGLISLAILLLPASLPFLLRVFVTTGGAAVLFLAPNAAVGLRRRERRNEVRRHLPDVIDLLEVCVSAGMGVELAWNVVMQEVRSVSPVLADEMALVDLEIHLGATRATAIRHMAERTDADEVRSLASVVAQADRFGTGIADALHAYAGFMREQKGEQTREAAEKLAVKLIFPMVLLIFPQMLVVSVGPAFLRLLRLFSET